MRFAERFLLYGGLVASILLWTGIGAYGNDAASTYHDGYQFSGFASNTKQISPELRQRTERTHHKHPEFGKLPHNTQCSDCIELIHKRGPYSRYFIEPGTDGVHFYKQKALAPLHYKTEDGWLRTINKHLQPVNSKKDFYAASHQPIPTAYDGQTHETTIDVDSFRFRYNGQIALYTQKGGAVTEYFGRAGYNGETVGKDGVYAQDAWPSVDIRHVYKRGAIKTDFIIKEPLAINQSGGYLVFEDNIDLPKGYRFTRDSSSKWTMQNGYWHGEVMVKKPQGDRVITFGGIKYFDKPQNKGGSGYYALDQANGEWHLKMLVPVDFLKDSSVTYPVTIDPIVAGFDSLGNFTQTPFHSGPTANLAFTNQNSGKGYCPYNFSVTINERVELFDLLVDTEVEKSDATFPNRCGQFGCNAEDLFQQIVTPCDSFTLSCNADLDTSLRYCTTDSHRVSQATSIRVPGFLDCVKPQCPDYNVQFKIKNTQTYQNCSEICDYRCGEGHYFAITIEGREVREDIDFRTSNGTDSVCAGEPVELISLPKYGVPVYNYDWSPGGQSDSIITVYPTEETTYSCTVIDSCGNTWTASKTIYVKPTPEAKAGEDKKLCEGGQAELGGDPTAPGGTTVQWSAVQPWASSYISQSNVADPNITIPSDSLRTYEFAVRVEDSECFQYDTATVTNHPKPEPSIQPDSVAFCPGESGSLSTSNSYEKYQWSIGKSGRSIEVGNDGSYNVTVTDANGCTASSSPAIASLYDVPDVSALPDTTIDQGTSAKLYSNIDLESQNIDDYSWSPSNNISCLDCPEPKVSPSEKQTYQLNITTDEGCQSADSTVISINFLDDYSIPSGFSPNDDGYNDEFYLIKDKGVRVKTFRVFNRWGQKVHDDTEPWDGKNQRRPHPVGVYVYYFELVLSTGEEVVEQGNVTLVR